MKREYILPISFLLILAVGLGIWFWQDNKAKVEEADEILAAHPLSEKLMGDLEGAEIRLEEARNSDERFAALSQIGFIYDIGGADDIALDYYKRALREKEEAIVYNNMANIYVEKEQFEKAEESFQKVIELNPNSTEGWRDLHSLYRYHMEEKSDLADDVLLEGLEKNKDNPNLLSALATYYQDQEEVDKAIEYYEKLLAVKPDNEAARQELEKLKNQ